MKLLEWGSKQVTEDEAVRDKLLSNVPVVLPVVFTNAYMHHRSTVYIVGDKLPRRVFLKRSGCEQQIDYEK